MKARMFESLKRVSEESTAAVTVSMEDAERVAQEIGYDGCMEQFRLGIEVESEHADIAMDIMTWGRIAKAHLSEIPDYYTRLAQMEVEGKAAVIDGENSIEGDAISSMDEPVGDKDEETASAAVQGTPQDFGTIEPQKYLESRKRGVSKKMQEASDSVVNALFDIWDEVTGDDRRKRIEQGEEGEGYVMDFEFKTSQERRGVVDAMSKYLKKEGQKFSFKNGDRRLVIEESAKKKVNEGSIAGFSESDLEKLLKDAYAYLNKMHIAVNTDDLIEYIADAMEKRKGKLSSSEERELTRWIENADESVAKKSGSKVNEENEIHVFQGGVKNMFFKLKKEADALVEEVRAVVIAAGLPYTAQGIKKNAIAVKPYNVSYQLKCGDAMGDFLSKGISEAQKKDKSIREELFSIITDLYENVSWLERIEIYVDGQFQFRIDKGEEAYIEMTLEGRSKQYKVENRKQIEGVLAEFYKTVAEQIRIAVLSCRAAKEVVRKLEQK